MKKLGLLIIFVFLFIPLQAFARLNILHPNKQTITVNSTHTFIVGNTDKNAKLYINSTPVTLWENNFFVYTVPLNTGRNEIKILSIKDKIKEEKSFIVINKPYDTIISTQLKNEEIDNRIFKTKTTNNRATIRKEPSTNAKRVIDLDKNVILYTQGEKNNYYKLHNTYGDNYWIHKSNVEKPEKVNHIKTAKLKKITKNEDDLYNYQKFHLTKPVFYTLNNINNNVILKLYGIENEKNNIYEYIFSFDNKILGYEAYYNKNNLIFKYAKTPTIKDKTKPLKGINIHLDAGHGGNNLGALAPDGILNEKDLNLLIVQDLYLLLQQAEANVSITRNNDTDTELYKRVNLAKQNNALISLSIHNNSLPYGKDPYYTHGTETHYYNENAKELAEIITYNLSKDLKLKNNGIHKSSFVLTRSTNPVSVLIECAYMIYPEEYIKLKNPNFRKEIAKSIEKSLEEFLLLNN